MWKGIDPTDFFYGKVQGWGLQKMLTLLQQISQLLDQAVQLLPWRTLGSVMCHHELPKNCHLLVNLQPTRA